MKSRGFLGGPLSLVLSRSLFLLTPTLSTLPFYSDGVFVLRDRISCVISHLCASRQPHFEREHQTDLGT